MSKKSEARAAAKGEAAATVSNQMITAFEKAEREHADLAQRAVALERALAETRSALLVAKGRAEGIIETARSMGVDMDAYFEARAKAQQQSAPASSEQGAPPATDGDGASSDAADAPPADDNVRPIREGGE